MIQHDNLNSAKKQDTGRVVVQEFSFPLFTAKMIGLLSRISWSTCGNTDESQGCSDWGKHAIGISLWD